MLARILGLLLMGYALGADADIDYPTFQKLTRSLMKVEAANADGSVSIGTGVVVGRGMVVTNCHVTQRARSIELVQGSLRKSVHAQQSDIEHDLCLLYSPFVDEEPIASLHLGIPRIGQVVYAVGYIFGIAPQMNPGQVNALYDFDGAKVIRSSTPFTSGASGGGLFDEEGRLIGIVTFKYRAGSAYHFSVPVRWVEAALTRFQGQPVAPLAGTPFWNRQTEAQPFFLRAATLEAEEDWNELTRVARLWTDAEAGNASAWQALGKAYFRMRQNEQSINAYKTALRLDGKLVEVWYNLGLAYANTGNTADTQRVHDALFKLDPEMASELTKHAPECAKTPNTALC